MRILEYTIAAEEEGWSVETFLKNRLHFGKKQISRLKFRRGGMQLNGLQCRCSRILKTGDQLCIRLDDTGKAGRDRETYEDPADLTAAAGTEAGLLILYEDTDVMAVYKPAGVPVHPAHGHSRDTLWNQIITRQENRGEEWTPRVIGRLDQDTSGIILMAKNTEAAALLSRQREQRFLRKKYLAEAEGSFPEKEGIIDVPLEKDPAYLNRIRIAEQGMPAVTHYRVLDEREKTSILILELEQGRTHQIRVHLASNGHPVVGDRFYNPACMSETESDAGKDVENDNGAADVLHLSACCLCFKQPFTGEKKEIKAPLPKWLQGGIKNEDWIYWLR